MPPAETVLNRPLMRFFALARARRRHRPQPSPAKQIPVNTPAILQVSRATSSTLACFFASSIPRPSSSPYPSTSPSCCFPSFLPSFRDASLRSRATPLPPRCSPRTYFCRCASARYLRREHEAPHLSVLHLLRPCQPSADPLSLSDPPRWVSPRRCGPHSPGHFSLSLQLSLSSSSAISFDRGIHPSSSRSFLCPSALRGLATRIAARLTACPTANPPTSSLLLLSSSVFVPPSLLWSEPPSPLYADLRSLPLSLRFSCYLSLSSLRAFDSPLFVAHACSARAHRI